MSSSSENEEAVIAVKRVKRRHQHRITGLDAEKQKINLYSHKILPKLDALAKSPLKITKEDEDEGNDCVPFDITPTPPEVEETPDHTSPTRESNRSGSDTSPNKIIIPPTPPPAFNPKKRGRRAGKANKLLKEVSTVLSQVSALDASHDSLILIDDSLEIVKEIMVKIRLHGRLQRFPVEESQTFDDVFQKLAKKAKVDVARLLITFGDRRVFPSDTPTTIQLSIADILECVVAHRRLAPDVKDTIKIQMQGPFQKKKVPFTMGKMEPFQAVMEEYARGNKSNVKELQFMFDGEPLQPTATPKSLDLDTGDCIDVMHPTKT